MKRFITYLYLYENGVKTINVGFVRVDVRNKKANMEISVRNLSRFQEAGKICVLVDHNGLYGVELGDMRIFNGQGNKTLVVDEMNIMDSEYSLDDVVGMCISFPNGGYVASCWKDEYADSVSNGEIHIRSWSPPQLGEIKPEIIENKTPQKESCGEVIYKKIDLNQIHSLPSKNWYLCNNSFLIHGFWNYGYLVIKKKVEENKEKLSLGIPGVFEKPEMVMAVLFGFPEFEALPLEMKDENRNIERVFSNIEKNQEPEAGTFGCWFVDLKA